MAPASGAPNYPATTIASDPYLKTGFTAEPQEMGSHLPSSMPSMSLSMVSSEQPGQQTGGSSSQVPPIRTQYASYVQTSTAPPPLSASATAGTSLSVPRYVDDSNPRPTKSPRNPSHPSIHASSISSTDSPSEYRYGPHYGSISSASADISPQTNQQSAPYSTTGSSSSAQDNNTGASATGSASTVPPSRDYFPPSTSWATTAGESSAPTYTNGDHRASYPYATDQYKTSGVKSEPHAPPAPVYPGQTMSHYSWNAS